MSPPETSAPTEPLAVAEVHSYDIQSYKITVPTAVAGITLQTALNLQYPTPVRSVVFLADSANTDTVYIGGLRGAAFPLAGGSWVALDYVDLKQVMIALKSGTANQYVYVTFGGY
jgi:hypothetical protein